METAIASLIGIALEKGIFATLFVWLFIDSRKQSSQREEKLMDNMEQNVNELSKISNTLERINSKLNIN